MKKAFSILAETNDLIIDLISIVMAIVFVIAICIASYI